MQKSKAPFAAPEGKKWCSRHNSGRGAFLSRSQFPPQYSYCGECKREYQREWDRTKRVRPEVVIVPTAQISKNSRKIVVILPNTEKARNVIRTLLSYWPDFEIGW